MKINNQYSLKQAKIKSFTCFLGKRDEFLIYNLENRFQHLCRAQRLVQIIHSKKGVIWWIGTNHKRSQFLKSKHLDYQKNHYYLIQSWVPGLLTNIQTFQKITARFFHINTVDLFKLSNKDKLLSTSFWKKLNLGFFQQRKKGDRFKTFLSLSLQNGGQFQIPNLIIILNPEDNPVALAESSKLNIPVICLGIPQSSNSNCLVLPINSQRGVFNHFCNFLFKICINK